MSRDLDGYDYERSGEHDQDLTDFGVTDTCPEHGEQDVTGLGECGPAHDPNGTAILACGHEVTSFGPGEPNVIVRTRQVRP